MNAQEAISNSQSAYASFTEIDTNQLTEFVSRRIKHSEYRSRGTELEKMYEAINGFMTAFEEYRFQTSMAYYYTGGLRSEQASLKSTIKPIPLSETVKGLIRPFRGKFSVSEILDSPETIKGNRIAGVWFAGQLINSSLSLAISASDKLFASICYLNGNSITEEKYPKFTRDGIDLLRSLNKENPELSNLRELEKSPINKAVRDIRNNNLHAKSLETDQNGDVVTLNLKTSEIENVISINQLQILPAVFHNLLNVRLHEILVRETTRLHGLDSSSP